VKHKHRGPRGGAGRRLRLDPRDPADLMGHSCVEYTWRDAEKGEYDHVPDFLEC